MSIGLEIAIEKESEDELKAVYLFFVREGRGGLVVPSPTARPGRAEVIKATGEVLLRDACPDDSRKEVLFGRVCAVLKRHWRSGNYPPITWWAG